jgi:hypothetical protein
LFSADYRDRREKPNIQEARQMKARMVLVLGVALIATMVGCDSKAPNQSTEDNEGSLIPYTLIETSESGSAKISFDVLVDLVEGRLPSEAELVAVSQHLKDEAGPHERTFVLFYLPGMVVDSGAFATAHHNPDLEFHLLRHMVPEEYAALLPPEVLPVEEPVTTLATAEPFEVEFDFVIEWEGNRPVVVGQTNLPDGTEIMTSVWRENPSFMAQDSVVVAGGQFRGGPFGPSSGLAPGTYHVDASMPYAKLQPTGVRAIIGSLGENLLGEAIERDDTMGATISVEKSLAR